MKTYTIKITSKDVLKAGYKDRTNSGLISDMLAMSLEQWTGEEMRENNYDYENEGRDYLLKEYNYEAGYIALLNKKDKAQIANFMYKEMESATIAEMYKKYIKSGLKFGAWYALNSPKAFALSVSDYEERIREATDDDLIEELAPDLYKSMQESRDDFWERLEDERINGSRDFAGLLKIAGKEYSATSSQAVEIDKNHEAITITWTEEEAHQFTGDKNERLSNANLKRYVVAIIGGGMNSTAGKQQREREARKVERERIEKYQAERAKEEEAERIKKLKAMKR